MKQSNFNQFFIGLMVTSVEDIFTEFPSDIVQIFKDLSKDNIIETHENYVARIYNLKEVKKLIDKEHKLYKNFKKLAKKYQYIVYYWHTDKHKEEIKEENDLLND